MRNGVSKRRATKRIPFSPDQIINLVIHAELTVRLVILNLDSEIETASQFGDDVLFLPTREEKPDQKPFKL